MQTWVKWALGALAAIIFAGAAFLGGYYVGDSPGSVLPFAGGSTHAGDFRLIEDAFEQIKSSAMEPPPDGVLVRGAIKGMIGTLKKGDDPYALFYSPQGYRSFQELTTGRFSGIGVWLKQKNDALEIVSVLPGTPALREGLKRGDVITSINGTATDSMDSDQAVGRIKGREGTTVTIGVRRGSRDMEFVITREEIDLPSVQARLTASNIGYIQLLQFANNAAAQVRDEVERLTEQGAKGIVLDMRDNGGGLFSEAVEVASVFIETGDIVKFKERGEPIASYEAEGDAFEDLPLVVLVNEGSASASEIVAGAFKDRERAILVGSTTYGKGSVQEVFELEDASALKLTTGRYFTPDGDPITEDGIEPDVVVDASPRRQRERAFEILRGIVLSSVDAQG